MTSENQEESNKSIALQGVPFQDAQEAWFWFISAQQARNDGARFVAGSGAYPRPCEPLDILKVLDRLYRHRRLTRDHFLVMRHYGRRYIAPDPRRVKEVRAFKLWNEAMSRFGEALQAKGIIEKPPSGREYWVEEALLFENRHVGGIHEFHNNEEALGE